MSHDLIVSGGAVITPAGEAHLDIAIDGERISELGEPGTLGKSARTIDATGKVVIPGLIDPHVHFGVGDDIQKWTDDLMAEDFAYASRDALVGGVTSIATTTQIGPLPMMDYYRRTVRCGESRSWCDFKITSVVNTHEHIREIPEVAAAGGVDFKFFTGYVGDQAAELGMDVSGITPDFFFLACEAMSKCDSPVFAKIHAEDPFVRGILVDRVREMGRDDTLVAWAETTPEWAESLQVYTYGLIAHDAGVPFYPVHISSAYTTETVKNLKSEGWNITGETLSMFLCTTAEEMDARGLGAKAKIQPPVRFEKDRERLWQGIREGTISLVGTDSHSFSTVFKESVDFWHCVVGINLQMADALPLLYNEGVAKGRIELHDLVRVMSENVARMYGLFPTKGAITVGSDADLVIFDPERQLTLGTHRYRSQNDYSLWEGDVVQGAPVMTILRGQVVVENGEIVTEEPAGRLVEHAGVTTAT